MGGLRGQGSQERTTQEYMGDRKCIRQHFWRMDSAWNKAEWQEV